MSGTVTPLPWDTDFFGFPIGRVDLDGLGPAELDLVDAQARRDGLVCLYGALDPADHEATYLVQEAGYRFVEAAVTFSLRQDEPAIARPPGLSVRPGSPADVPELTEAASLLAPWSRFAVDPRFGAGAARRMQAAWLDRAAACTTGEFSLVVAEDDTGIVAFITRARDPEPIVDTSATLAPGSGAARYLIEDARAWAGDQPLLGGPIAARNITALRHVSYCGFRVARVRYLYHRWLDGDDTARS